MGDQFVDIVMIAYETKRESQRAGTNVAIAELRRDAVIAYAETQFTAGRYKNLESARNTLHDAVTRRLQPDVGSIEDFDKLLNGWLRKGSGRLAKVLRKHARTAQHRELIRLFFAQGELSPGGSGE